MGRPLTGKQHVGIRREHRPNGDVYVYERITGYDPKTQKTKTLSTRLLGKIPAGSDEMIPTRPRKKPSEDKDVPISAERSHHGLRSILDWIGRESGIDADLRKCFSEGDALKLASIARYWLATDGETLPRLEDWQLMNPLPYSYPITQDVYGGLFKSVGENESGVQSYFKCRSDRAGAEGMTLALDTTTFSTYSKNQIEARRGFNKDGDGLDTIKLLVMYSVMNREPVAFAKQPGNIPDRISITNALKQLEVLGLPSPVIVADNGFYNVGNMTQLVRSQSKFMMLASNNEKWVREEIDASREALGHFDNVCPFDTEVCGVMRRRMHEFSIVRKRTRGSLSAGDTENFTRRPYVHVFHKPMVAPEQETRLCNQLLELKSTIEGGAEELKPADQKLADRFLVVKRTARSIKVSFNMAKIEEAKQYWGYFVLVSNEIKDPFKALEAYRAREKIEELLATYKDSFDGRKPRTWYPERLYGRQFAQFIGLGYHCFLSKRILDVKAKLRTPDPGKTQAELDLEKKLLSWLNQRSLVGILDWFKCVDHIAATGGESSTHWTTETTRRDRLFLKMLGVTP